MILFNFEKIYKATEGKLSDIFVILDFLTFKTVAKRKRDRLFEWQYKNWSGDSFLINPEPLIYYRRLFTKKELSQYIILASKRSYAEYKLQKTKTLDLGNFNYSKDTLINNRLLRIEKNIVYFLFEEVTGENLNEIICKYER